jgi:hypothetical protein
MNSMHLRGGLCRYAWKAVRQQHTTGWSYRVNQPWRSEIDEGVAANEQQQRRGSTEQQERRRRSSFHLAQSYHLRRIIVGGTSWIKGTAVCGDLFARRIKQALAIHTVVPAGTKPFVSRQIHPKLTAEILSKHRRICRTSSHCCWFIT